jgi:hypothetical protein
MGTFGITMPVAKSEEAVKSCAAAAAGGACDELSFLSALAECLLIRPGISVADKAIAVNVNVASDFFMVGILYQVIPFPKKTGRFVSLKGGSLQ